MPLKELIVGNRYKVTLRPHTFRNQDFMDITGELTEWDEGYVIISDETIGNDVFLSRDKIQVVESA